ncbi:putative portal protein [Lactobacillus phage JCL1032]|uniref:portal protein n=1 Tax=Lactobacillus phage JCL1032 TaxID=37105 RepID=UPI000217A9E9|nr:portal protein [Lactobacillus phage JCL1032]ACB72548.1 putative portal protein [Lactobacillus phage JCL1032]
MSFMSKVRQFFGVHDQANQIVQNPIPQPLDMAGVKLEQATFSREHILESNEYIFSIVTRLSNVLASLPLHEYQNYKQMDNEPLADLLKTSPNPNMTAFEFIARLETDRNVSGNGYAWIQKSLSTGEPIALWPLDPNTVSILRNTDNNSYWYRVTSDIYNFTIPINDVIHVKHVVPSNSWYGVSPIDVLSSSLKFQRSVENFSQNEMEKKDKFVLQYDRSISPEKRQAMVNDFLRMVKENGGAVVQEAGWKVDRYESKFEPADLSSVEQISRIRIATAFNVPISFLNDDQAKSTTNVEHVTHSWTMTLMPIIRQYESQFNMKLFTPGKRVKGFYFSFNVNGLLRGDTAARTQYYQTLTRNGIFKPNEIRELEGQAPIPDEAADHLYISKDLYPLDKYYDAILDNKIQTDASVAAPKQEGGENTNENGLQSTEPEGS